MDFDKEKRMKVLESFMRNMFTVEKWDIKRKILKTSLSSNNH